MSEQTVTVDFETYYDKEFSLSKMQTDAYVLDPRFEVILVSVIPDGGRPEWFSGTFEETRDWLHSNYNWSDLVVRGHHALFDGFIMTQKFGIKPKRWTCTLKQGRMLFPHLPSHSLASIAQHLGLGEKGTEVQNALGKRRLDFTRAELERYAQYCVNDSALTRACGVLMDERTPLLHQLLIDMTVRMFTEPVFVGDQALLRKLYSDEVERKRELLERAQADRALIMSNDKLADALELLGVIPPKKISKTTGRETYAFAKTDKEFTDLLEHDLPEVQALVAARLGAKTTIAETRAWRFVEMAQRGPLPVYLNFWGAKTTGRYSGGNQVNWQNLPARGPSAGLRYALKAPDGHLVMAGDSSNIELRMVMAVAGQSDVLAKLRAGIDLYCDFATTLFGRVITKADTAERQLGKVAMLSLQYGAGAERFQEMVRVAARSDPALKPITLERAQEIVHLYRSIHHRVKWLWDYCNDSVLPDIAAGCNLIHVDVNGWTITQNEGFGRPGEPGVMYKNLRRDNNEWVYDMGRGTARIYGPKVVENLCQHLAMQVVMWQTARINRRYPVKLSVHDEAVTVPRIEQADDCRAYMTECLSLAPPWCRDVLPVACEVAEGASYGDAK